MTAGPLALVGGDEWQDGCTFDEALLAESGADHVVVLPTAAAYESPGQLVDRARMWFEDLGARVTALPVLGRTDALDEANVRAVREARFLYLASGSPMHLRSVVKDTPLYDALLDAWTGGAVLAGSAAGGAGAVRPHGRHPGWCLHRRPGPALGVHHDPQVRHLVTRQGPSHRRARQGGHAGRGDRTAHRADPPRRFGLDRRGIGLGPRVFLDGEAVGLDALPSIA
jgi:hypothetical protein